MKKFLAVFLAMVLCLSVFSALAEAVNPDDIEDNMTSADGKYEIAFVTDVGDLKDKSFNEGTWNGVKLYAHDNGMSYKYYKPANDSAATDDDRYDAMKAAAEAGAKAIVCAGFMQGTALEKAAKEFTDVKFIFIDGWGMGLDNVVGVGELLCKEVFCFFYCRTHRLYLVSRIFHVSQDTLRLDLFSVLEDAFSGHYLVGEYFDAVLCEDLIRKISNALCCDDNASALLVALHPGDGLFCKICPVSGDVNEFLRQV